MAQVPPAAGAVPPAPPAIGPGGPTAVAPQRTYVDFYNDDSHDTAQGAYANIMATFEVPAANPQQPQVVANAVYASAVTDPQAFILLVSDPGNPDGRVSLFHRLQRFEPSNLS